jgi:hypothetical protein
MLVVYHRCYKPAQLLRHTPPLQPCRLQFLARPFVPGDNVTLGSAATGLTGIVERITPMRTTLRTEDDILVTIPNKVGPQHCGRSMAWCFVKLRCECYSACKREVP